MRALIACSLPLGKIMKEHGNWFKETNFGLREANIQTAALVSIGWLLFSTNNTKNNILK